MKKYIQFLLWKTIQTICITAACIWFVVEIYRMCSPYF